MRRKYLLFSILLFLVIQAGCSSTRAQGVLDNELHLSGAGCIVLNYHRIREPDTYTKLFAKISNNAELNVYSIYTDEFASQLSYLKDRGVQFITVQQLQEYISEKRTIQGKCALVTFDDIDRSVYEQAFPILKRERIPAISFMIMGQIGNENFDHLKLATARQLQEMKASNLMEIGLHTYNMHYFAEGGKPPFIDKKRIPAFVEDTKKAEEVYEQLFHEKPLYYAYPFGFGIPETDTFLSDRGYQLIFSLDGGIVTPDSPSFFVKRVLVTPETWKTVKEWADSDEPH